MSFFLVPARTLILATMSWREPKNIRKLPLVRSSEIAVFCSDRVYNSFQIVWTNTKLIWTNHWRVSMTTGTPFWDNPFVFRGLELDVKCHVNNGVVSFDPSKRTGGLILTRAVHKITSSWRVVSFNPSKRNGGLTGAFEENHALTNVLRCKTKPFPDTYGANLGLGHR